MMHYLFNWSFALYKKKCHSCYSSRSTLIWIDTSR